MENSSCNVLILAPPSDDVRRLEGLLGRLQCQTVVVRSTKQAIAHSHQISPCLVILADQQHRLPAIADQLRQTKNSGGSTIVALSDCHAPDWISQDDTPAVDGFLVKPMTSDVLTSLVQSAWMRQTCYQAG